MKKQYRVKKSNEIEEIIKEKKYASNPYFSVYKRNNPNSTNFRYAISVGKKLGNAVVRNKFKRQIRAIVDAFNINLNDKIDVFIIVKVKVLTIDFNQMQQELKYLFRKQKLIKGEKND